MEVTNFKVLLVEDNEIIGNVMTFIFTNAGCQINLAKTGREALGFFEQEDYDLILMDIGLPDANGLGIARTMRTSADKSKAKTPIAIVTAHSDMNPYLHQAQEMGIEDFIVKPCTIKTCDGLIKKYSVMKTADLCAAAS